MSDRKDNRPEVDMKTILEERAKSGSPIKVIEVSATTQEVEQLETELNQYI